MYITQHTDYAFRVLIYAAAYQDRLVNIAAISEYYNISKSHLMKVVTALVKGGFLVSIRGKGGGLRLARSPKDICLGDVIRLLEPLTLVECMSDRNECVISSECFLAGILSKACKQFLLYVDNYTLADLQAEKVSMLQGV